jgi:hypothetical protein
MSTTLPQRSAANPGLAMPTRLWISMAQPTPAQTCDSSLARHWKPRSPRISIGSERQLPTHRPILGGFVISCQDHGAPQGHQRRRAPATTVEWGHRQPVNVQGRKSASVWVRRRRQSFKSWSRRITVSVSLRCFPTFSSYSPFRSPLCGVLSWTPTHPAQTLVGRRSTTFWRAEALFHITHWQGFYCVRDRG